MLPFQAEFRPDDGGPDLPVVGGFHPDGADDGFGMLGAYM
jgi:hypothetical protein